MIDKKLTDIKIDDLKRLVENNVLERKTLEYKSQLPSNSDSGKKEFLADVSSFANTFGGDIVYGITENKGSLGADIGFQLGNPDGEIARLENIIRDGIFPRLDVEMQIIDVDVDKKALIIRTKPSLEGPHRVVFKGSDKFYKRNSNGKYQMDVAELRLAFLQTSNIIDQIKTFRKTRVFDIKAGDTPIPLVANESFTSIHILPLSAFSNPSIIDSKTLLALSTGKYSQLFAPVRRSGWSHRINLEGVVAYSGGNTREQTYTYTQLYRNGNIEGVECDIISSRASTEKKILPMGSIELDTMQYTDRMLKLLAELGFQYPYYIFLTLTNVKGFEVSQLNQATFPDDRYPIDIDDLLLPEVIIENPEDKLESKFQPIFDMIWNASGVSRSLHYDEEGNYIVRP